MPKTPHNGYAIGITAALVNVLFWGIAPSVIKFGLDVVPPEVFLYYRFIIAVALATPVFILMKSYVSIKSVKDIIQLAVIGIFSTLNLGVLFLGLTYTTSSAAAIIAGTVPLFVIVGSGIFLKERITKNEVIGAVAAMVGTIIIVGETPVQVRAANPLLGNMIIVAYNFVWTTGILLMKKYAQRYSPFMFGYTGWVIGLVFFGIVSLINHPMSVFSPGTVFSSLHAVFPIVYMAVFGSIVAFTAYQVAQKHLPASQVSIFTYLQTVIAVPISVIWLQEKLGLLFGLGAVIIVLGVFLAEIHPKSRVKELYARKKKKRR